jgi:hypothetical protein
MPLFSCFSIIYSIGCQNLIRPELDLIRDDLRINGSDMSQKNLIRHELLNYIYSNQD